MAFDLNLRTLEEWSNERPDRPRATRATLIVSLAAVLLLLVDLVLVLGGAYFVITGTLVVQFLAFIVTLIGIECRPRIPRLPRDAAEVDRLGAPSLFAVIDAARIAVGAPPVDVLVVDDGYNAFCSRVGLRRRVVLGLGLSLWGALDPAGRMALLGHELGHLVNGDPTRSTLTQPALETFGRLAALFDPRQLSRSAHAGLESLLAPLGYVVYLPFTLIFGAVHRTLVRVALKDHQRAEIYADVLAVRLGGSVGAQTLMRALLFARPVLAAIQRCASSGSDQPTDWLTAARTSLDGQRARTRTAEQVSLRMEASAYSSHPPSGLRLRLVTGWPLTPPVVPPPVELLTSAEHELREHFATTRRRLSRLPNVT